MWGLTILILNNNEQEVQELNKLISSTLPKADITTFDAQRFSNVEDDLFYLLKQQHHDVVYLSTDFISENTADLLPVFKLHGCAIVQTSSNHTQAIPAIKQGAFDFLHAPFDELDVLRGINRLLQHKLETTHSPSATKRNDAHRIVLPDADGLQFLDTSSIIKIEASGSYSTLSLTNGKTLLISKNLKELENAIHNDNFIRVHKSYLVNKKYIEKYVKKDGGYFVMKDGSSVGVSRRKRMEFGNALWTLL